MARRPLLSLLSFVLFAGALSAQDTPDPQLFRMIDGSQNNPLNTTWGTAGENLQRLTDVDYADGISLPGGEARPNPRLISNEIFAQAGLVNDPLHLSDFCWVFGQFIDHDIGLTPDGPEPLMIEVPKGDPWFDPMGAGQALIPMRRNIFDPATGIDAANPRQHPNMITAFIDGSGVYGSEQERADWLRTFEGGKLRVSAGNLLPYNTTTGEFDAPIDTEAPHMDNPVGLTDKVYVAGDARANENPLLLAFHTLFVREHNRIADELAGEHPDWDDEELYQMARKKVGGIIQSILYNEWLPAMGVNLVPYQGYDSEVNPQLFQIFTAAAFRLGHTLLNGTLRRLDNNGDTLPIGHLALRDAFFNPLVIEETGGIEPFLKGMATQIQQGLDAKVIDDVRNFLFGPPGAGGLDLPAININRGRERGLPDFNTVRRNFGLQPYYFFAQLSFKPEVVVKLNSLYKNINNIDPWVGMLAETPMYNALFGETIMTIMKQQFTSLRDGDRFFYENDPLLTDAEKREIRETTMYDVVMRNTDITLMQTDVFRATAHSQICENMQVEVTGQVRTINGLPVPGVAVTLQVGEEETQFMSNTDGEFATGKVAGCDVRHLGFFKEDRPINGVSTLDLIFIQKHILDIQLLDSPYKMIAADVNNSQNISTLDLINLRKVVLGINREFTNNSVWRFIPANYEFPDPANPWLEAFPEDLDFNVLGRNLDLAYVAVKTGDINGSADLGAGLGVDPRSEDRQVRLVVADQELTAGRTYRLPVAVADAMQVSGYQFSLRYDPAALSLQQIEEGMLPAMSTDNFAVFAGQGLINTSWNEAAPNALSAGDVLFTLEFTALRNGTLGEVLSLGAAVEPVAYDEALAGLGIQLTFTPRPVAATFELYQNQPNPVQSQTVIPFFLPDAAAVRITIFDGSGRVVRTVQQQFAAGMNQWTLNRSELPAAPGILYYQVETDQATATRRMILVE